MAAGELKAGWVCLVLLPGARGGLPVALVSVSAGACDAHPAGARAAPDGDSEAGRAPGRRAVPGTEAPRWRDSMASGLGTVRRDRGLEPLRAGTAHGDGARPAVLREKQGDDVWLCYKLVPVHWGQPPMWPWSLTLAGLAACPIGLPV